MKGKVGVVERLTVVMCRGEGHVLLSSRPESTIQAKLSPVLNHYSERAEVWTGPWSLKKQTLENVAFEIITNERVGLCRGSQASMSNTRLRRRSSATVEIWNVVWTVGVQARTGNGRACEFGSHNFN